MRKILLFVLAAVFISACLGDNSVYHIDFAGNQTNFRADLTKAEKISLEPGPEAVREAMFINPVNLVRIAFVPDDKNNGYYSVAGFELQYKTILAYKQYIFTDKSVYQNEDGLGCVYFERQVGVVATQRKICFESLVLNSTDEVAAMANETAPIILMDAGAPETKVSIDGSVVRIMGKDMSQNNRKYTDLDLAVDKFLLVLMNESIRR